MKELALYKIRDMAMESGRAVFSVQQLANLTGKSRTVCTVYASRLVKKGMAWKIRKGKISFEQDEFIIATQLIEPSYISLGSALLFHGLIKQAQKNVECVAVSNSIRFRKLGITYHKIPSSMFFGFKKHAKGRSYIIVADPEKALLDGLYLNVFTREDVKELSDSIDVEKLKAYAKQFGGHGRKKLEAIVND